jgi:tetratricopeptide (TPR) repeat protein
LEILGHRPPKNSFQLVFAILRQILRQTWQRFIYPRTDIRDDYPEALIESARSYAQLGNIYYLSNDTLHTLNASLYTLNLSERAGESPELARAYANMNYAAASLPWHWLARVYEKEAWKTAINVNQLQEIAYVAMVTGIYHAGVGNWSIVNSYLTQAIDINTQLGDSQRLGECMGILAVSKSNSNEFEISAQMFKELIAAANRSDNELQQVWGLVGISEDKLRKGDATRAQKLLETAMKLLMENYDPSEEIRAHGLLALALLRQGKYIEAKKAADTCNKLIEPLPTVFSTLLGYIGIAEVYLNLWQLGMDNKELLGQIEVDHISVLAEKARYACKKMQSFARVFPIGLPRTLLYLGLYYWFQGNQKKACRTWQKSIKSAKAMKMPFEVGLVHLEMGRLCPPQEGSRLENFLLAKDIFKDTGALYQLERVSKYLDQE